MNRRLLLLKAEHLKSNFFVLLLAGHYHVAR